LSLVERHVSDQIVDLLRRKGSSEIFFGDEVLVPSEGSEGFQDLRLGFGVGGLGADKGNESLEADASVGADLSDDAIKLGIGKVFSDGLQRALELEAIEEAGSIFVEVLEDFFVFGKLFGSNVGV